jgi:two-component system C4-dicarboxylate transport sensor histidine kinase DctB
MNMSQQFESAQSQKGRRSVIVTLIAMTLISVVLLFFISLAYFKSLEREAAQTRLSLYQRSLNDTLDRHQHLPYVLAQDSVVQDALNTSNTSLLNQRLASVASAADLEAIYVMDLSGNVLAASNYDKPHSFIGQNYGFRPYFKEAASGRRGNYFGVGATTGRPGYFVSEPVRDAQGSVRGIIAIKLDVSELQLSWEGSVENVLAINKDGIVVLASNRNWLYSLTQPLTSEKIEDVIASKQFRNINTDSLLWKHEGEGAVDVQGKSYIHAETAADHLGWKVHYLLSDGRAFERALLATVVFGSAVSLLVGIAAYLRSIRIQSALNSSQLNRALLLKTNTELEVAHAELAQSSKLAALGQLSASVVHELGQPISAFRNYLAAEEIGGANKTAPTLKKLGGVVDRMENITKQLRFFTKPGEQKIETVEISDVISGALELVQHDIEFAKVKLKLETQDAAISVFGNRLRLEQVLVNLIKNSLAALNEASTNELVIALQKIDNDAVISVQDNGLGIGDRDLRQLQEPFHTTRASGDGMGLGLSISAAIIKEHNGRFYAANLPDGGALFQVYLPIAVGALENPA